MKVITNFTVVDEDQRGYQQGFRNLWNSRGEHLIEVRLAGSEVSTMQLADFKKLLLAGERIAELLAIEEKKTADATEAEE